MRKLFQVKMKYIMLMDIYEAFCKEHDSYNQYRVLRKNIVYSIKILLFI